MQHTVLNHTRRPEVAFLEVIGEKQTHLTGALPLPEGEGGRGAAG